MVSIQAKIDKSETIDTMNTSLLDSDIEKGLNKYYTKTYLINSHWFRWVLYLLPPYIGLINRWNIVYKKLAFIGLIIAHLFGLILQIYYSLETYKNHNTTTVVTIVLWTITGFAILVCK